MTARSRGAPPKAAIANLGRNTGPATTGALSSSITGAAAAAPATAGGWGAAGECGEGLGWDEAGGGDKGVRGGVSIAGKLGGVWTCRGLGGGAMTSCRSFSNSCCNDGDLRRRRSRCGNWESGDSDAAPGPMTNMSSSALTASSCRRSRRCTADRGGTVRERDCCGTQPSPSSSPSSGLGLSSSRSIPSLHCLQCSLPSVLTAFSADNKVQKL
eukprot:Hpha_TRINITY_DN16312_c1_g3::TRINITY_DN16312_c1_g3_i1::g.59597::m.59597